MGRGRRVAPVIAAAVFAAALGVGGCYAGSAHDVSPRAVAGEPGWTLVSGVPFVHQERQKDCGAAALAMVLSYWSVPVAPSELGAADAAAEGEGIRAGQLRDWARGRGLEAYLVSGDLRDLATELGRGHPVLVGVVKPVRGDRGRAHYEVVIGIHREKRLILTLDPAAGWRENSFEGFAREWVPSGRVTLVVFPAT